MDLARISTTALYAPPAGPRFVFLLGDPTAPPASIALADTWADDGPPRAPGWYVFVPAAPAGPDAPAFETALRARLDGHRGFAWATPAAGDLPFELVAAAALGPDPLDRPMVTKDVSVALPAGMPALRIVAGLTATGLRGEGQAEPAALGLTDAAGQAANGIVAGLTGATSGCLSFAALGPSPVQGDRTVKPLAAVQVDPLDPFDPDRTRVTPLGPRYAVVAGGGGWHLEAVPA